MSNFPELSERQEAILLCIRNYFFEHHHIPTIREIGDEVGLTSTSSVKHQLDVLHHLGYVRKDSRRPRTMEITELGMNYGLDASVEHTARAEMKRSLELVSELDLSFSDNPDLSIEAPVTVPVVGKIAAGSPILADQHIEEVFSVPRRLTGSGEMFALRVQGDSMIEAAICNGDWVIVRKQAVADNGEIVAALLDGEATVKVFQHKGGHITLLPCNEAYDPIPADDASILGKVVSVLRAL